MATLGELQQKQKMREERDRRICSDYLTLMAEAPGISPTSALETLAERYKKNGRHDYPMTMPGLRRIVIAQGVYTTK